MVGAVQTQKPGGMGFKDLAMFKDALLAKQTWRLLHDTESLFYRVFKEKFFPNSSIMEASVPSSSSYAWRSIIHGKDVIKKGSAWRIGNGKSARILGDNWLPSRHQPQIISPCLQAEQDMRVALLFDQENRDGEMNY